MDIIITGNDRYLFNYNVYNTLNKFKGMPDVSAYNTCKCIFQNHPTALKKVTSSEAFYDLTFFFP